MKLTWFDYLKILYNKTDIKIEDIPNDAGLNVSLFYTLLKDKDNAYLTFLTEYIWYIKPSNFFILMFLFVPKKTNFKLLKSSSKEKDKKDKLEKEYKEIKEFYNWSEEELEKVKPFLKELIEIEGQNFRKNKKQN